MSRYRCLSRGLEFPDRRDRRSGRRLHRKPIAIRAGAWRCQVRLFYQVAFDVRHLQARAAKPDMPVGAQQIERSLRDLDAGELGSIGGIGRNGMNAQQVSELTKCFRIGRLPDHKQVEGRVVEMLEQVLDLAIRLKLEPHPWEALA